MPNFNTTLVKVHPHAWKCFAIRLNHFNTTLVKVHPDSGELDQMTSMYFNTTLVKVHQGYGGIRERPIRISIQPLLRFIGYSPHSAKDIGKFQYNPC